MSYHRLFQPLFDSLITPPDPEEHTRHYTCPECKVSYTNPAELRMFHFTDGEIRKQCLSCQIDEDEVIEKKLPIDEFDWNH